MAAEHIMMGVWQMRPEMLMAAGMQRDRKDPIHKPLPPLTRPYLLNVSPLPTVPQIRDKLQHIGLWVHTPLPLSRAQVVS